MEIKKTPQTEHTANINRMTFSMSTPCQICKPQPCSGGGSWFTPPISPALSLSALLPTAKLRGRSQTLRSHRSCNWRIHQEKGRLSEKLIRLLEAKYLVIIILKAWVTWVVSRKWKTTNEVDQGRDSEITNSRCNQIACQVLYVSFYRSWHTPMTCLNPFAKRLTLEKILAKL